LLLRKLPIKHLQNLERHHFNIKKRMENVHFSITNLLNIVTLCVTLLFVFQIYFLKKKSKSNTFFSMYLFNIAIILMYFLVLDLKFKMTAYALIPFLLLAALFIGPMLWIYIKLVVGEELKQLKKHLYLPLGFGLISLILISTDFLMADVKTSLVIIQIITYMVLVGLYIVFILQSGYYIFLSLKLYKNHLKNLGDTFSYTEKVNLSWFKLLIYGYLFFILGLIATHMLDDSISNFMFYLILLSYVIYSGYNALNQYPIFEEFKVENKKKHIVQESVDTEFYKDLKARLLTKMEKEKLFLDSSLTIHSLAHRLNSNNKYVSQLINNDLKKNFVLFVNEYRIQEAKKLLLDKSNNNLTIESIGYDAGFKSKSAFNAVFKKITNQTPSEFRKK